MQSSMKCQGKKARTNNNIQIESVTTYVLTNLKKNKKVNFGENSPEPAEE